MRISGTLSRALLISVLGSQPLYAQVTDPRNAYRQEVPPLSTQTLQEVPELRKSYDSDEQVRQLLDVGTRLEGLCRHASTHAAGVVIAPRPIDEFAPLYRGTKAGDEVTTQWAKDEVEEIGLLKMDFLGLKTLTLIDDALDSIEAAQGQRPDLDAIHLAVIVAFFDQAFGKLYVYKFVAHKYGS